jgi:hypothetical protein
MARKTNELYIGDEFLTLEGGNVKHPSLSEFYANLNVKKITDEPMEFIGIDLETNHKTAELKLLGFCDMKDKYDYYTKNFLGILFLKVKEAYWNNKRLVWWNKLDHFVLYKQFLKLVEDEERDLSLLRFGKVSGEYLKQEGIWEDSNPPIIQVKIGNYYFGISNVIRSSIQFYFINEFKPNEINKVWAYDIASMYLGSLEKEAKRLPYYSKVDKSAHLVNWEKFDRDKHYREKIVLQSNYLDARAVKDLALLSMNNFYKIFKWYPTSLISAGSLARAGIVATITNLNNNNNEKIINDLNSIPLISYKEEWVKKLGDEHYKSLISIFNEAYSGGYIESVAYGSVSEAYMADIASAYPSIAVNLWDLRNSKLTHGKGTPPHIKYSYCFIRGDVTIPDDVDYHPITVKHPHLKDTNIRAVGSYRASYTLEERDYLLTLGAKFKNEEWYNIETDGKLSPLAIATRQFLKSRKEMLAMGDSAEYTAKTCANSIYGILYEAIRTYKMAKKEVIINEFKDSFYHGVLQPYLKNINLEDLKPQIKARFQDDYNQIIRRWNNKKSYNKIDTIKDELLAMGMKIEEDNEMDILEEINYRYDKSLDKKKVETALVDTVIRGGYRVGEFNNPLYASVITSQVRILISKGSNAIKKNGGQPIVIMTDSIFWKGHKDMLPPELWREEKTLGYFEKPEKITNMVCLGAGRYEFYDKNGDRYKGKKRGLNIVDLISNEGVILNDFKWSNFIDLAIKQNSEIVKTNVRMLISVGLVNGQSRFNWDDLGLVMDDLREVELIVGHTKRIIPPYNLKDLKNKLIVTKPLFLDYNDHTLPLLREKMMAKKVITEEMKNKKYQKVSNKNYYENNKKEIKQKRKERYRNAIKQGIEPSEARNI